MKIRLSILILMEFVIFFCLFGILYTILFDENPLVAIPESVFIMESSDITYSLVVGFVLAILGLSMLIIHEFKNVLSKSHYTVVFMISIIMFFIIQGVFFYGIKDPTQSWLSYPFYINYFNLYESYVNDVAFAVLFSNAVSAVLYSVALLVIMIYTYRDLMSKSLN